MSRKLLTIKETAERLSVTEDFLRCGWTRGTLTLPRIRLGSKSIRVRESDLEAWISGQVVGADHETVQ